MRTLNEKEIRILEELQARYERDQEIANSEEAEVENGWKPRPPLRVKSSSASTARVDYHQCGNYTVAIVRVKERRWEKDHVGVSKFNPNDAKFNAEIGRQIAFKRAIGG